MPTKIILSFFALSSIIGCAHSPEMSKEARRTPSQVEVGNGSGDGPKAIQHETCILDPTGDIYGQNIYPFNRKQIHALEAKGFRVLDQKAVRPAQYLALSKRDENDDEKVYRLNLVNNGVPYFDSFKTRIFVSTSDVLAEKKLLKEVKFLWHVIESLPVCQSGVSAVIPALNINKIEKVGMREKLYGMDDQEVYLIQNPVHKNLGLRFALRNGGFSSADKDQVCRHFGFEGDANLSDDRWKSEYSQSERCENLVYLSKDQGVDSIRITTRPDAFTVQRYERECARPFYTKIYCHSPKAGIAESVKISEIKIIKPVYSDNGQNLSFPVSDVSDGVHDSDYEKSCKQAGFKGYIGPNNERSGTVSCYR